MINGETFFSIDIGTYALKVCLFEKNENAHSLIDAKIISYLELLDETNFLQVLTPSIHLLKNLFNSYECTNVYLTLSNAFVKYQSLRVQFTEAQFNDKKYINSFIEKKKNLLFPSLPSSVSFNSKIIPIGSSYTLLLFAFKNSIISNIYHLFQNNEYTIKSLEFNIVSLSNYYYHNYQQMIERSLDKKQINLIFSLGQSTIDFAFLGKDLLILEQLQGFNLGNIDKEIAHYVSCDLKEARVQKELCNKQLLDNDEEEGINQYNRNIIVKNLKKLNLTSQEQIKKFLSNHFEFRIETLYFSGGNSSLYSIEDEFSSGPYDKITYLKTPFEFFSLNDSLSKKEFFLRVHQFNEAFGCALNGFDIHKVIDIDIKDKKKLVHFHRLPFPFKALGVVAILMITIFLFPVQKLFNFSTMDVKIKQLEEMQQKIVKKTYDINVLKTNISNKYHLLSQNKNFFKNLMTLYDKFNFKNLWFTQIDVDNKSKRIFLEFHRVTYKKETPYESVKDLFSRHFRILSYEFSWVKGVKNLLKCKLLLQLNED